jgi:hypothetical protein
MTIIGEMDTVLIAKKLKMFGKIDVISVGSAKEEKRREGRHTVFCTPSLAVYLASHLVLGYLHSWTSIFILYTS